MNPTTFKVKYREANKFDLTDLINTINSQTTAIQTHSKLVEISSSQILNCSITGTPILILPAPGTGFYNVINRMEQYFYAGSSSYTAHSSFTMPYQGASGVSNSVIVFSDNLSALNLNTLNIMLSNNPNVNSFSSSLNLAQYTNIISLNHINLMVNQPIYIMCLGQQMEMVILNYLFNIKPFHIRVHKSLFNIYYTIV